MRYLPIVLSMLLGSITPAQAQISIGVGISLPGISIGINIPSYPQFVQMPGYPVYYAPRINFNYFFYDGLYWVYQRDNWYASSWYNGPWQLTAPEYVPLFVLRIPVRYYRQPPAYFRGWRADESPRWGDHWGSDWEQRRSGWDQWDRRSAPRAAPLPAYQRQYSGNRYPRAAEQQNSIRSGNYRYRPREAVTQQFFQQPAQPNQQPQPDRQQRRAQPPQQQQRPQTAPQGKAQDKKPTPQKQGRGNRNDERDQGRP